MKKLASKLAVMCMALLLTLGVLAGCGPDPSTPAGMLEVTLTAMKKGDIKKLEQLTGTNMLGQEGMEVFTEHDFQRLIRAMFGNISVQVTEKQSDENTAVVTVKGETGVIPSVLPDVGKNIQSEVMAWYERNQDKILDISSADMNRQIMNIMVTSFEKYKDKMERIPIDEEIHMTRDSNGDWMVDPESGGIMGKIVFGSEDPATMQGLLNNLV